MSSFFYWFPRCGLRLLSCLLASPLSDCGGPWWGWQLLAKYHKFNLFHEAQFDKPPAEERLQTFRAFGVEFGLLVCFDLLFHSPTMELSTRSFASCSST